MSSHLRYVARRLLLTLPVLLTLSVVVFLIVHLIPGDPAQGILGIRATPPALEEVRHQLQLDEPLPSQYVSWLGAVLRADLGRDYVTGQSVGSEIGDALPATVELALLSMLFAIVVGVPLGTWAAYRRGAVARATRSFVVVGTSIVDFWLGIMLVLLFTTGLALLPPFGYVPFLDDPVENLRLYILPVLALGTGQAAYLARTTQGAVEEALNAPHALFLRAKGLRERDIVFRHILRNAGAPIVTVCALVFGVMLGGAIVIESVFSIPGVGSLLVKAISQQNYTVVQGAILVIALLFLIVNLAADIALGWIDPRIADGVAK